MGEIGAVGAIGAEAAVGAAGTGSTESKGLPTGATGDRVGTKAGSADGSLDGSADSSTDSSDDGFTEVSADGSAEGFVDESAEGTKEETSLVMVGTAVDAGLTNKAEAKIRLENVTNKANDNGKQTKAELMAYLKVGVAKVGLGENTFRLY